MATTIIRQVSPYFECIKVTLNAESGVNVELKQNMPCLSCKKAVSIESQNFCCELCEIASYCSSACRTKDKRFHKQNCIPKDRVEVINSSSLVIEVSK